MSNSMGFPRPKVSQNCWPNCIRPEGVDLAVECLRRRLGDPPAQWLLPNIIPSMILNKSLNPMIVRFLYSGQSVILYCILMNIAYISFYIITRRDEKWKDPSCTAMHQANLPRNLEVFSCQISGESLSKVSFFSTSQMVATSVVCLQFP